MVALVPSTAAQAAAGPGTLQTTSATTATSGAPASGRRPRAWILVDADRGTVLDAGNDRAPMPPASLTKLLTALIAVSRLAPTDTLTVSARAAGEPAHKISMEPGQVWNINDVLYALLLSSANDAAAALAERLSGSLEAFATQMQRTGAELGLQDNPVLRDPAGLDDNFSVDGGNLLSARDLAIITRAVLAQPLLAQVIATPVYEFTGPDGAHHKLGNHNKLLASYSGAIGGKTGYTSKAGEDLVAAARRNGRTMIAIVMGAPNLWKNASDLLDEGFALAPGSAGTGDALPAVRVPGQPVTPPPAPRGAVGAVGSVGAGATGPQVRAGHVAHGGTSQAEGVGLPVAAVLAAGALAVMVRRRQVRRRRRRRRAARQVIYRSGPPRSTTDARLPERSSAAGRA